MHFKIRSQFAPGKAIAPDFGHLNPQWKRPLDGHDSRDLVLSKDTFYMAAPELDELTRKNMIKLQIVGNLLPDERVVLESFDFDFIRRILEEYDLLTPYKQGSNSVKKENIFIVHGHDEAAKQQVARLITRLGLEPVILHEKPNGGKTIIEKFEHNATDAAYAIVLMTPDDDLVDQHKNSIKRARQNVILEWGYFAGKLGRGKVCMLYKKPVEIPSDILGVIYLEMDGANAWETQLAKEMKAAGMNVDLNKL